MSDDEESLSDVFSASEEEWKPNKEVIGGDTSDDDDSDFEDAPKGNATSSTSGQKNDVKASNSGKTLLVKKRKSAGQSLREKLYNKYRPPPKTLSSPVNIKSASNSPSASSSQKNSKNAETPNESNDRHGEEAVSSDDEGSLCNYLVKSDELDLQSSFFNKEQMTNELCVKSNKMDSSNQFDCNAGLSESNDSESKLDSKDEIKTNEQNQFNFENLLKNLNSLEQMKEAVKASKSTLKNTETKTNIVDIYSVLALGEKSDRLQNSIDNNVNEDDEDDEDEDDEDDSDNNKKELENLKLIKTKSKRIKRHGKLRPISTVVSEAGETDDSDWEEVTGNDNNNGFNETSMVGNLEIHVPLLDGHGVKKPKTQEELELSLKRKLNRQLKLRQLSLHKVSLLFHFARNYRYNRLLNDTSLMQAALKLLPSSNAYPSKNGTEIKYFESLIKWFKQTIKLTNKRLYPMKRVFSLHRFKYNLLKQIDKKEARCIQDMIFIFIILVRGMGLQCRLISNMQPLPMKPHQSDLIPIKLKLDKKDKIDNNKCDNKTSDSKIKDSVKKQQKTNKSKNLLNETKLQSSVGNEEKSKNNKLLKIEKKRHVENTNDATSIIQKKPKLSRLKCNDRIGNESQSFSQKKITKRITKHVGSKILPNIIIQDVNSSKNNKHNNIDERLTENINKNEIRIVRSRSKSPNKLVISPDFLKSNQYREKIGSFETTKTTKTRRKILSDKNKVKISPDFMANPQNTRTLRSQVNNKISTLHLPQFDGADNIVIEINHAKSNSLSKKRLNLKKLRNQSLNNNTSDDDFQESNNKKAKVAPLKFKNDKVTNESQIPNDSFMNIRRKENAIDLWVEVWCDVEEHWSCIDILKNKIHCVETICKSASSNLAYVYAFQNDLSIKDVTPRYCFNWANTVRKNRLGKDWLDSALAAYIGIPTKRDIKENEEMFSIQDKKPLPTAICDYKNHPLYALERHLLKFEAIYPPNAPALGYVRGQIVYSRDCVHILHSREIWLKQARQVKLGEKPYKIVKARPKWDRMTQEFIKDQPLEIFGYWQTEDYKPPTAENGLVPRNPYGNVDLFQPSMLPKKTVHLKLSGLNRICRKLRIDCANAVIGFDFHQGACHPIYDGFVICEEFLDTVTAAWYQEQEEQNLKEREKYEARVYGNWKRIIRGLLIRERVKRKYNFK